jgi:hypothetical protein
VRGGDGGVGGAGDCTGEGEAEASQDIGDESAAESAADSSTTEDPVVVLGDTPPGDNNTLSGRAGAAAPIGVEGRSLAWSAPVATRVDEGHAVGRGTRLLEGRRRETCRRISLGREGRIHLGIMGMLLLVLRVCFIFF